MRRVAKVDRNQPEVVDGFRARGARVLHLHQVGSGCPDLLVAYRGRFGLVEVKRPGESLNAVQCVFHAEWGGQYPVFVARTDADVAEILAELTAKP